MATTKSSFWTVSVNQGRIQIVVAMWQVSSMRAGRIGPRKDRCMVAESSLSGFSGFALEERIFLPYHFAGTFV